MPDDIRSDGMDSKNNDGGPTDEEVGKQSEPTVRGGELALPIYSPGLQSMLKDRPRQPR